MSRHDLAEILLAALIVVAAVCWTVFQVWTP